MSKKVDRVGLIFTTNEGYSVKIVEYKDANSLTIEFENGFRRESSIYRLELGMVKNPFHKTMYNIGFFGDGIYKNLVKGYSVWNDMFSRCYELNTKDCYKDCSVHPDWHNFQNFAKWYEENFDIVKHKGFQLDKDLLVRGNKIYGPSTCCFVPREINMVLTKQNISKDTNLPTGVRKTDKGLYDAYISIKNKGILIGTFDTPEEAFQAYKGRKELRLKELAEKWKLQIPEKLYLTLVNYKL